MKKLFVLVFAIALCLGALCIGASADYSGTPTKPTVGSGTEADPYQISTAAELYWFAGLVNGTLADGTTQNTAANAVLTADIRINTGVLDAVASGSTPTYTWTPIGTNSTNAYTGSFNGNDKTISGLYYDGDDYQYVGLFGCVGSGGEVKNVKVADSYIGVEYNATESENTSYIGGICGTVGATSTVSGCSFNGTVSAVSTNKTNTMYVGGVCGRNEGKLQDLIFSGSLTVKNTDVNLSGQTVVTSYGGGICGYNIGTVESCINRGTIIGGGYNPTAGGICGFGGGNTNPGTIQSCENYGQVTAITEGANQNTCSAGGILGDGSSNINSCINKGYIHGANFAGGIAGRIRNGSIISSCTNSAKVMANYEAAGGICGYVSDSTSSVRECINSGDIELKDNSASGITGLGGICGIISADIVNCYNSGNLRGSQQGSGDIMHIGGICGQYCKTAFPEPIIMLNCCSTGSITSPEQGRVFKGGVYGSTNTKHAKVEHCFWLDRDGTGGTASDVTAMTEEQFARGEAAYELNTWTYAEGTYNGEVWKVGEDGYPVLTSGTNDVVKVTFVDSNNNTLMTCCTNKHDTLKGIGSIYFGYATLKIDGKEITGSDLLSKTFDRNTTISVVGRLGYKLTATVEGSARKAYDGSNAVTDASSLRLELSGIKTGDQVSVSSVEYVFDTADAGNRNIIVAGVTLAGEDASKYALDIGVVSNEATGTITQKELTASISGTVSKVYDGLTNVPAGHGLSIDLEGVINGESVSATATSYVYVDANVGQNKTITATGITLGGTAARNYVLSPARVSDKVGTITKKTLTPSISGTVSKVYDGTTGVPAGHGLSIDLEDVVDGDKVSATAAYAFDDVNVGENKTITATGITLTGADAGNYVLSATEVSGSVGSITLKKVTITAEDKSAYMGDAMPGLSYKVEGFLDGDGLTEEPVLSCDADMIKAGIYEITVSGGAANSNYELSYKSGTLTVKLSWVMTVRPANGAADVVYYIHPGDSFELPDTPKNSGYIFLGWRSGDTTYRAGEEVDITSDMTFTAVWGNLPDVSEPEEQPEPELPFYDVTKGDWFYDAVKYVYYADLMDGVDVGVFAPNDTLTRAMVWTIIARAEGVDTSGGATWYAKAQDWVVGKGISDGTEPNAPITREQLVTMLWRLAGEPALGSGINAPDAGSVSSWAQQAMSWAMYTGLIEGDENGAVTPAATATRAQAAAIMMRYLES